MNNRSTTKVDNEIWKAPGEEERRKKGRRNLQKRVDLADNTVCDFMVVSSEEEERWSEGRRGKRWSAASSEEQLALPALPRNVGFLIYQ